MSNEAFRFSIKNLVSLFAKMGVNRLHHDNTDIFEIQEFNLIPINLDVGFFTPFLFPKKNLSAVNYISNESLLDLVAAAHRYINKCHRKFGVLVIDCKTRPRDIRNILEEFSSAKIALLSKKELEELMEEKDRKSFYDKLGLLLTLYLGRNFLSPYVPGRPAVGGRFFARSQMVRQMFETKSHYMLVGIRRIGKTSLLARIGEKLRAEQGHHIVELYGGKCSSIEDVLYELYVELGLKAQSRQMDFARNIYLSSNAITDFHRHIKNEITKENKPIAFLIDEFDHLIEIDERKQHRLIQIFRELAINENCRFIFAGFRKLKKAAESVENPLFNFGQIRELEPFTRSETYEMITTPLIRLGIKIDETTKETIYDETGGLPELIQIFCAAIVEFYNKEDRPPDSGELSREIADSMEFKSKIGTSFLANSNSLEQLVCYLMVQDAREKNASQIEFTIDEVRKLLLSRRVKFTLYELNTIIENLQLTAVVKRLAGKSQIYKLLFPQLKNYLQSLDLEFEIKSILSSFAGTSWLDDSPAALPPESPPEKTVPNRHASQEKNENENTVTQNILYWTHEREKIFVTSSAPVIFRGNLSKSVIDNFNKDLQKLFNDNLSSSTIKDKVSQKTRAFYLELKDSVENINKLLELNEKDLLYIDSYLDGLGVPFELIPLPEKGLLATKIPVTRRLRFVDAKQQLHAPFHIKFAKLKLAGEPFRVLIVANDDGGALKEVKNEAEQIKVKLKDSETEVVVSHNDSIERIEALLREKQFHLLHFCGHTKYVPQNEQMTGLSISSEEDNTEIVSYGRFARAVRNSGTWLVYLSSCHGAVTDLPEIGQTYLNCMEALIEIGIPNVIGFRWAVEDFRAKRFASEFYAELFIDERVRDLSLVMLETRKNIWNAASHPDVVASSVLISQNK